MEEESGWSHLPEEHQEDAGGFGDEAASLRALGLAWGKPDVIAVYPTVCLNTAP